MHADSIHFQIWDNRQLRLLIRNNFNKFYWTKIQLFMYVIMICGFSLLQMIFISPMLRLTYLQKRKSVSCNKVKYSILGKKWNVHKLALQSQSHIHVVIVVQINELISTLTYVFTQVSFSVQHGCSTISTQQTVCELLYSKCVKKDVSNIFHFRKHWSPVPHSMLGYNFCGWSKQWL
jgi:hypothetical protein